MTGEATSAKSAFQGCIKLEPANPTKVPCRLVKDPAVVVLVVVIVIDKPSDQTDYEDEDEDEDEPGKGRSKPVITAQ